MKKTTILASIIFLNIAFGCAQNRNFGIEETIEHIVKIETPNTLQKEQGSFLLINSSDKGLYFAFSNKSELQIYLYDETNSIFKRQFSNFSQDSRDISSFLTSDDYLFYCAYFLSKNDDIGYRKLYLYHNEKNYYLDSLYSVDKDVSASSSKDNEVLLINSFYILPDFYDPNKDDYTYIYHIDNTNAEIKIKKDSVYCKYCSNSTLINDKLFYTISNEKDDWDNYSWKDIYFAPWNNFSDTTRIASRTQLLAVSSDGKYILGKRYDLFNGVCVIIDVETKKYQILLGRNYQEMQPFYSEVMNKFGFYFNGEIIYVDYPKTYPFDALKKDNPLIPISKSSEIRTLFKKQQ